MKVRQPLGTSIAFLAVGFFWSCSSSPSHVTSPRPPGPTAQPAAPPPPMMPPPPPPAPAVAPVPPPPAAPAAAEYSGLSPATTEILRLKDAGYSEDFLLNRVRRDNQTYRLTVDDLIALRRAGLSEIVIDAMLHAGTPALVAAETAQPVARHAEFDGLVRQQQGFLGIGDSKKKKVGKFVIEGERVNWYQMTDPEDNFSVAERSIKEMWLNCAPRAGENLCLEICFKSYSGKEGCFRDAGWENGENRQVLAMYDYFQKAFPTTFFSQREKKTF